MVSAGLFDLVILISMNSGENYLLAFFFFFLTNLATNFSTNSLNLLSESKIAFALREFRTGDLKLKNVLIIKKKFLF